MGRYAYKWSYVQMNILVRYFLLVLILFSPFSYSSNTIEVEEVKSAVEWMDKYTKSKNIDKALKFYSSETKFYYHDIVDGKETVMVNTFAELLPSFKESFRQPEITQVNEETLEQKITLINNNLKAEVNSKSREISILNGKEYEVIGQSKLIFSKVKGNLVLLESHYKILTAGLVQ
jgi:hypothetical protein